jgi:hypothetical protein
LIHGDRFGNEQVFLLIQDKSRIRRILRAMLLWSKGRKINGKPFGFGYTLGLVRITHRLLQIAKEEEAFWILNAMIRANPRLFSMTESSLEGDRLSLMRTELTIFKSILR